MVTRLFLICLGVLSVASAALYWTLPDQHTPVPVLYWITQVDTVKLETIEQFKLWRKEQGLPPVEVRIDNINQDPTKKLAQGLSGVGADIFDIYTFETEIFGQSGMLMDITELGKAGGYSPAATYPELYGELTVNGRQIGFPRNVGGNMIWVNQDTFAKYGVPEPSAHWDWDEFERLGKQLVAAANPPGTRSRVYFMQTFFPLLLRRGLGLDMFNETMTRCALNDPRNAEVLKRMYRWIVEEHLVPTLEEQHALAADAGRSGDDWFYHYIHGRYAMLFCDRWAVMRLREMGSPRSKVVEPFGSGFRNMEFGCGILSAYAGSKHPKEAAEFLQFLTSERFNLLVARSGDALPPIPKYAHSEAFLRPPDHPDEWEQAKVFEVSAPEIGIAYGRSPFVQSGTLYRPVTGIDMAVQDAVMNGRMPIEDAGRIEAARVDAEIALNVRADAKLRQQYDTLVKVQALIDARRAAGQPVPVNWITNPFHRAYYKSKGWLAPEEPMP